MNASITIEVTYEQAKALAELGLGGVSEILEGYRTAEHRIRNNIDRVSMCVEYVDEHQNDEFDSVMIDHLLVIASELDELFDNELVNKFYLNKQITQKQRLNDIRDKADFLYRKWNTMKTDPEVAFYPGNMTDTLNNFLRDFNA